MCGTFDLLSYCAHPRESLRTPNNEYITYSQKLDLELALQVKQLLQEHRNRLLLFPRETERERGRRGQREERERGREEKIYKNINIMNLLLKRKPNYNT